MPDTQETTPGLDSTEDMLLMPVGNGDDIHEDTPAYAVRNDGVPLWVIVSFGEIQRQVIITYTPFLQMTKFYFECSLLLRSQVPVTLARTLTPFAASKPSAEVTGSATAGIAAVKALPVPSCK